MCRIACIFAHVERFIAVEGVERRFDWHEQFGPTFLNKRGDPAARQPARKSHVWDALFWWGRQGRRTSETGECIWEPEPVSEPILEHLGGKHWLVTGYTERVPEWALPAGRPR